MGDPLVISVDFPEAGTAAVEEAGSPHQEERANLDAITAVLAVFELCKPRGLDCAISRDELETVLECQLGSSQDASHVIEILDG